ncbi:GT-D fold domain-containing glycosyltransferase [Paenibacillus sp. YYML68]|uniref:GT-D fold domain-containing protein n=1 Tax=Paenibacillus sp. YYML68 TaxID=2909250 RepID=UPI002492944D|nr:GT-D fold domain-containing glycosyltransferase [Paenibacillus sp. YYML68]
MLDTKNRIKRIEARYGRKVWGPRAVYRLADNAVKKRKPVSIIRLGDVMAKLLARRQVKSLNYVSQFLGVKLPPSPRLQNDLEQSVKHSDLVGLSHYPSSIGQLKAYMRKSGWKPRRIADSFVNDLMYKNGYLHKLMRSHRVALVGRAAPAAAARLRKLGYRIVMTCTLDHYNEMERVLGKLKRRRHEYDLVLVGASVPGRILCTKIKRRLGRSAIEIGHMMDALAKPSDWKRKGDVRRTVKFRWMRKLKARSKKK